MKLGARHIAPGDCSDHDAAIVGGCENIRGVVGNKPKGMHEICVSSVLTIGHSGEQWMIAQRRDCIPAHVRDFQRHVMRFNPTHRTLDPSQSRRLAKFHSDLRHELHADADAKKGVSLFHHSFLQGLGQANNGMKPVTAVLESANARQHDPIGTAHFFRIPGHENFSPHPTFRCGALERLLRRAEVAGSIIHNCDTHHAASTEPRSPGGRWKYFNSASWTSLPMNGPSSMKPRLAIARRRRSLPSMPSNRLIASTAMSTKVSESDSRAERAKTRAMPRR